SSTTADNDDVRVELLMVIDPDLALHGRTCYEPLVSTHLDTQGIGATYVVVLVTVILTIVHLNSRISVTETHVIKSRLLRSAVAVPRADIAEAVVTRSYAVPRLGGPRTILLDRNGETLLHSHPVRELAEVEALAQVAPHVTHVPVLRPEEARERWPRMLPWSHANHKAGVILGFGIVLGVVVIGVLTAVLFG
ncbi:hypothetical protein, partial [Ornithinimicrobium faecis]|uniref:hypothetical protein n=1 Tax=Ornithinimicrobium faecis TaxID=2934158 RepID=UPI002118E0BE